MAEAEVQDGNGDSSSTKTVIIIIVVVALAALGFYLLSNRSTEEQPSTEREEVVSETEGEETEEMVADLEKLRLFKTFAEQVEPILSEAGKESLQVVVVYVETNPESLEDKEGIPENVVVAAESVWAEIDTLWGDSVVVLQESTTVVTEGGEDDEIVETPGVEVGDVVTLDGPIELADIESPLGPVFSVVSNVNSQTYYLVFDETETERVTNDLLDQEVTMQVEVTAIEEGTAGFKVVEGPTLVV